MMKVNFRRPQGFNTEGRRREREMKNFVAARLIAGLTDFHNHILTTPVYTGRTLVNFRWSIGSPVEGTRGAMTTPALPGKTSDLPLGSEPRRAANAEVINAEFKDVVASLKGNPFQDIYLRNNLDHYSDVEYGVYATQDGKTSRTPPGGMTRRGEASLQHYMEGILKRVA